MPEESSPVCPNHQREMLFDLLSEQYICPECQEERREAIRNARAQSPFTPEEAFPGRPEYARSLREKYMTKAFSKAWTLLKAGLTPDGKPTMTEGPQVCPCDGDMNCKQCKGMGLYYPSAVGVHRDTAA